MDQGQQINQEPLGLSVDLFEYSDQEFRLNHLRDFFDVQEEVVQECPEIIIQSLDMNYSTNVDTLHINKELSENIEEETYRCINCGSLFKSLPELKLHTEQHLFVTSFPGKSKCLVCDGKFEDSDEMSNHYMSQLHTDSLTEYTRRYCSKLCKYDKLLQKDLKIHNSSDDKVNKNDKGVNCNILNEEVADNLALINHKARHVNTIGISQNSSTIKTFPCDSCDKVFKSKYSQNIHSRIHTGERPFNCKYCDKSFADKSTRTKHERIHTGKRPYICAVCEKAFNQRVTMRKHIKFIHAGYNTRSDNVEEYTCIICMFFCQSSTEFYLHLLQHSDEKTAKSRVRTPKNQSFVLKGRDDIRTCSTVAYCSSISNSTVMNSSLPEESKKNDSPIESDGEICVSYKYLTHIKKPEIVVQNKDEISNNNSTKIKCKYQCFGKIGNEKNTWSSVSKVILGQFDTDSCKDKPILISDEQSLRSTMIQDDMSYNLSVTGPSESQAKPYKICNNKFEKSEQNSYGSKYAVLKSELIPIKRSFVLKDGECTRTSPTVQYFQLYASRSNSSVMSSLSAKKSK